MFRSVIVFGFSAAAVAVALVAFGGDARASPLNTGQGYRGSGVIDFTAAPPGLTADLLSFERQVIFDQMAVDRLMPPALAQPARIVRGDDLGDLSDPVVISAVDQALPPGRGAGHAYRARASPAAVPTLLTTSHIRGGTERPALWPPIG